MGGFDKDGNPISLAKAAFHIYLTLEEREIVREIAAEEGIIEVSNVWRRAMRLYMETKGREPGDLFIDRKPGNRLSKKGSHQRAINTLVA